MEILVSGDDCMKFAGVDWFTVKEVGDGVMLINEGTMDTVYLVTGTQRALLIDTGWGVGDLPSLVRSLTSLPVTIVNTHGHPDHVSGDYQFDRVHIAEADRFLLEGCFTTDCRNWAGGNILSSVLPTDFDITSWIHRKPNDILSLSQGDCFDLGNRTLQVLSLPGHTPGGICLLDEDAKLLFTGDSILAGSIWMQLDESLPLGIFLKNLRQLSLLADKFDTILPAHGIHPLPKSVLFDLIDGIEAVTAGRKKGIPHQTFAGDGLLCEFGTCGVVYREDNL